jgi:ribonuclease Z
MPSDTLAQAGEGATLLIHEATMGDDQEEMACAKAHSTISQAIDVAKRQACGHSHNALLTDDCRMRAQNVLLTHFSSRYPTMPRYFASSSKKDGTDYQPTIALAMDHACIRVGDLWKMAVYIPAIKQSFKDIADEGDEEEEVMLMRAMLTE